MKKQYEAFALLCMLLIAYAVIYNHKLQTTYVVPAEFEKQQAIWLQSPEGQYVSAEGPVYPDFVNIIKALASHVKVNLIVDSKDEINSFRDLLKANEISSKNIVYYVVNHYSIWTRDVGPLFVKNRSGRLSVVDFGFNNYGKGASEDFINVESNIHRAIAKQLGFPLININMVAEGGALEFNGKGVLMTTEACVLNRNPQLTTDQIANQYKKILGIKKVIWLKKGLAEDDPITMGHVNEIARFASPNTILLAQVLPGDIDTNSTSYESYQRLEENYNILQKSTDANGKPFHIIRIPMPPTLYSETDKTGKIPVRSYLNYAVTNGAVVIPSYWLPGRSEEIRSTEEKVRAIFQSAFPGRQIISVNAENINFWGGGIHCISQHMPASSSLI